MTDTAKVWLITGASRGFGIEIAQAALAAGHRVAATARTPESITDAIPDAGEQLLALALDVTDQEQSDQAVAETLQRFGRIDVLVNNAGRGLLGAVEEATDQEVRNVFDVNVFGLLDVTRSVLPTMRAQKSGLIVNLSSSGGIVGRAGWGVYCATKFAVEGLTEALRQEVAPLGMQAIAIEPGGFRTDFLDASSLASAQTTIEDYAPTAGAVRKWAGETNHQQPGDPAKAAQVIVGLAGKEDLPERLQLGDDCFNLVADKLARVTSDQRAWRQTSISTNHN